jgi:hypothetical protein
VHVSARLRAIVVAITLAAALLLLPGTALAGCGGTESAVTQHRVDGQLPPLALGDSTMLLSLPGLAQEGFDANAHGCRFFSQGTQLLAQLKAAGQLPHLVVMALGANGQVSQDDINAALSLLGPSRLLVIVTHRNDGGALGPDVSLELADAKREPNRLRVLNWAAYSQGHASWFDPDGLHLEQPGVTAFTQFLAQVLPYAYVACPAT